MLHVIKLLPLRLINDTCIEIEGNYNAIFGLHHAFHIVLAQGSVKIGVIFVIFSPDEAEDSDSRQEGNRTNCTCSS